MYRRYTTYMLIKLTPKPPVGADHSPPVEEWQAYVFCNACVTQHVRVLHNVKPLVQLQQAAVLSDGVVVACLHKPNRLRHQIMQTIVCLGLLCLTVLFPNAGGVEAIASENHFQTREKPSQPAKPQQQQVDPLTAYPATQYVVHGVIAAADNAVAVVYSPNNTWHRLQVDAQLGQELAVIQQITTRGIQIKMQDTLLWLPVLQ